MNWAAVGAVGEVLGGLAVLATLVYLAFQVRSMRQSYVADWLDRIVDTEIQIYRLQLENAELIDRGNNNEELSKAEWYKIDQLFSCHHTMAFHGHMKEILGGNGDSVRARQFARILMENPAYLRCWREREKRYPDISRVQNYVDSVNNSIDQLSETGT